MTFKLIVSTVKPALTDDVVDAAKAAGATGATVIPSRGVGVHEASTVFGLTLEAHSDVILFLITEAAVDPVLEAIRRAGKFEQPGTGIAYVLPVERAIGLESQMERFEEEENRKGS
jgi:nitrogen regulatory protein PII